MPKVIVSAGGNGVQSGANKKPFDPRKIGDLKFDSAKRDVPSERLLQRPELEAMLRHLIRVPRLFDYGRQYITTKLFDRDAERHIRMVWRSVLECAEKREEKRLPDDPKMAFQIVAIELESTLEHSQEVGPTIEVELTNDMHALFGDPEKGPDDMGLVGWIFSGSSLDAEYGQRLIDKFIDERCVYATLSKIMTMAGRDNYVKDFPSIVEQVRATAPPKPGADTNTLLGSFTDAQAIIDAEIAAHAGRKYIGMDTGLDQLDAALDGWRGTVLLAGPSGAGKTALATYMARQVVARHDDTLAIVFSLEMPATKVWLRLLAAEAKVPMGAIMKGTTNDSEKEYVSEARTSLAGLGTRFAVIDRDATKKLMTERGATTLTADVIAQEIAARKQATGCTRAFIVVDNLAFMDALRPPTQNEKEVERNHLHVWKGVADRPEYRDDAFVVLATTRKLTKDRNGATVVARDDVRGTGLLVFDADAHLIVNRMGDRVFDDYDWAPCRSGDFYEPTTTTSKHDPSVAVREFTRTTGYAPIACHVDKARDGTDGVTVGLAFEKDRFTFLEVYADNKNSMRESEAIAAKAERAREKNEKDRKERTAFLALLTQAPERTVSRTQAIAALATEHTCFASPSITRTVKRYSGDGHVEISNSGNGTTYTLTTAGAEWLTTTCATAVPNC